MKGAVEPTRQKLVRNPPRRKTNGVQPIDDQSGFFARLIGDGRSLLALVALSLILSGGFVIFQSATGKFLPQDEEFLRMTVKDLCGIADARIVHFMFHDRVSFGGSIIAIGILYLWLLEFPMQSAESWTWWVFLLSGLTGFGSFLTYLGYGYLDTWHGIATLFLLVPYVFGMFLTGRRLEIRRGLTELLRPGQPFCWNRGSIGRGLLLATGFGMLVGGSVIMIVGMTHVFVPQDTAFMRLSPTQLNAINPRLIPLIAHDRAGFGGGVGTAGLVLLLSVWRGRPSRSLWQAVVVSVGIGFAFALGIHPIIGYTDFSHLLPAYTGLAMFLVGVVLSFRQMHVPRISAPAGFVRSQSLPPNFRSSKK